MRLAYVAGPFTAPTPEGIEANVDRAAMVASDLWRAGLGCFLPHANSGMFFGLCDEERFMQFDLAMLAHCDCVVVVPHERGTSAGTEREIAEAEELCIPIFYSTDEAIAWSKRIMVPRRVGLTLVKGE